MKIINKSFYQSAIVFLLFALQSSKAKSMRKVTANNADESIKLNEEQSEDHQQRDLQGYDFTFVLVETVNHQDIMPLEDGDTIYLGATGTDLSIRGELSSSLDSVDFFFDGAKTRTEQREPYAIKGDDPAGVYKPFSRLKRVGSHTVTARGMKDGAVVAETTITLDIVAGFPPPTTSPTKAPISESSYITELFIDCGTKSEKRKWITAVKKRKYEVFTAPITGNGDIPASVFQTHRYSRLGPMTYTIPSGLFEPEVSVQVTIGFAEIYLPNCDANMRVMDITVQDSPFATDLDVYAVAGCNAAYSISGEYETGADGSLSINFSASIENPMVSFIEIETI